MGIFIGIDLGGTKIAAAAVDVERGTLSGRCVIPTKGQEGPDAVLARIAVLVEDVRREAGLSHETVQGIGIGAPSVVDMERGQTLMAPNLPGGWHGVTVAPTLSQSTGYPTWLINDARAFTLAEATWGAGRGARTVVCLVLGTGIGGGIALEGRLHLGIDGTAGEFGHITVDPNGPPCGCGNRGCLEALASGPAITAMGAKAVVQGVTTQIGALVDYDLNRITPETIQRAAEAGDEVSQEILHRAGVYIGVAAANLTTILSPDRIVIGGGVSRLGDWLSEPIQSTIRERCHAVPVDRVQVVAAALGEDAGIIGAAMWASQQKKRKSESVRVD